MHSEPWVTIDVEVDMLWTSLSCSLHAEKHGTDLRAQGHVSVPISAHIDCPAKLARSFIGPSASVLSRARRTTTKFIFVVSWQTRSWAGLKCESANLFATSQSFCMISSDVMTHLHHNELCLSSHLRVDPPGSGGLSLVHTVQNPVFPFPSVRMRQQGSSIPSDKSRNAPAFRAWDLPSHRVAYPDISELMTMGTLEWSLHSTIFPWGRPNVAIETFLSFVKQPTCAFLFSWGNCQTDTVGTVRSFSSRFFNV